MAISIRKKRRTFAKDVIPLTLFPLSILISIIIFLNIAMGAGEETALGDDANGNGNASSIIVEANGAPLKVTDQYGNAYKVEAGSKGYFEGMGPGFIHVEALRPSSSTVLTKVLCNGLQVEDAAAFQSKTWFRDVTFTGEPKNIVVESLGAAVDEGDVNGANTRANVAKASNNVAAATASDSKPAVGDVFKGNCSISSVSQNGSGGSVNYVTCSISSGILKELGSVTAYCADHSAAAPQKGQGFSYIFTITSVNPETGKVKGTFYATANSGSTDGSSTDSEGRLTGYQRVSVSAEIEREYEGYIKLKKVSSISSMTSTNPLYSLTNARYRIYKNSACTKSAGVKDIDTKQGAYVKSEALDAGTYYVKEVRASKGFELSSKVYKVVVKAGETVEVGTTSGSHKVVTETPRRNPAHPIIAKVDADTDEGAAQGSATLQDARFTVRYFQGQYATVASAEASGSPKRTWVFKTGASGKVDMCSSSCLVSGTPYKTSSGNIVFPLGTYVIQETKAPEGYRLSDQKKLLRVVKNPGGNNTIFLGDVIDGAAIKGAPSAYSAYDYVIKMSDPPIKGSLAVQKRDSISMDSAQGDATFEGTTFEVRNSSNHDIVYEGSKVAPGGVVCTLAVDGASNMVQTADRSLPYGKYTVTEVREGKGYKLTAKEPRTVAISSDGQSYNLTEEASFKNEVESSTIRITKSDKSSEDGKAEGDATLEGTEFQICNCSAKAIVYRGAQIAPGETVCIISTDREGNCPNVTLPFGTYSIKEVKASEGYLLSDTGERVITAHDDNEVIEVPFANEPIRGSLKLEKRDLETGEMGPLGAATLGGTRFEITNESTGRVYIDGAGYASGEVCYVVYTGTDGIAQVPQNTLPYGTYSLRETSASTGYLLTDEEARTFQIRESGQTVFFGKDEAEGLSKAGDAFYNQVIRADLKLIKVNGDNMTRLPMVAMEISSKATGERHVAVTDENGEIRTESTWNAHTRDTNANDSYAGDGGSVGESPLNAYSGLWWGVGSGGAFAAPRDDLGALPFGDYTLRELRVSSNQELEMIEFDFSVRRNGVVLDLGTLDDNPPTPEQAPYISTSATDSEDGDKIAHASGKCKLTDTVNYMYLTPNKEYALRATLLDAETLEQVPGGRQETRFIAKGQFGTAIVQIECDTLSVAGKDVVFFEELYLGDELVCDHKEPNDYAQKVKIAKSEVDTYARDSHDGDKEVSVDDGCAIVDEVSLTSLIPGETYSLYGVVIDKSTMAPAIVNRRSKDDQVSEDDVKSFWSGLLGMLGASERQDEKSHACTIEYGKKVDSGLISAYLSANEDITKAINIVSKDIFAKSETMNAEMDYPLGEDLDNGEYVVFDLLLNDDIVIASHADTGNPHESFQTTRAAISTTASDKTDGDSIILPSKEAKVIDTVRFEGLKKGVEYKLRGKLVNKTDGLDLCIGDKPIEVTKTFTPNESSGSIEMEFSFDATGLEDEMGLVAFEYVTKDGMDIAEHADLSDEGQTVYVSAIHAELSSAPGPQTQTADTTLPDSPSAELDSAPIPSAPLAGSGYYKTGVMQKGAAGIAFFVVLMAMTAAFERKARKTRKDIRE